MAAVMRSKSCLPTQDSRPVPTEPANEIIEERRKNKDGQVILHKYLKGKLLGKVR
jgi:hypothetical protein